MAIDTDQSLPKVSIIIPFYNVEEYFKECLLSVVNQTYPNLEIILVDDCSLDNSIAIAEEFAVVDKRIIILKHDTNQAHRPARDTGMLHATGEYIFFLDSDVILKKNAIHVLVENALGANVMIVIGCADRLDPSGEIREIDWELSKGRGHPYGIILGEDAFLRSFSNNIFIPYLPVRVCGPLFSKELLINSKEPVPTGEYEEMQVIPFLYFLSKRVLYIKDLVFTRLPRQGSISRKTWDCERVAVFHRMWECINRKMKRYQLDAHLGNVTLSLLLYLIYDVERNGIDIDCELVLGRFFNQAGLIVNNSDFDERLLITMVEALQRIVLPHFPGGESNTMFFSSYFPAIKKSYHNQLYYYFNANNRLISTKKPHDERLALLKQENNNLDTSLRDAFYLLELAQANKLYPTISRNNSSTGENGGRKTSNNILTRIKMRVVDQYYAFIIGRSEIFDREWYLVKNPDVASSGMSPEMHYLLNGWKEGRDPGPGFSTTGYLNRYPDVSSSGVNPLLHYLRFGQKNNG